MLLRFEFINEEYSGRALSRIVINILKDFNIRDRVLVLTIDNASNNLTLLNSLNELLAKSINNIFVKDIIRLSYLAYIIQLSVKALMEIINTDPQAEIVDINWLNEKAIEEIRKAYDISRILIKVCYNLYYN